MVTRFLEYLRQLPIMVEQIDSVQIFGRVLLLARAYGLSLYDAAYLDLALRWGLPLATQDQTLRAAALTVVSKFLRGKKKGTGTQIISRAIMETGGNHGSARNRGRAASGLT